jgi:hypothetical protein
MPLVSHATNFLAPLLIIMKSHGGWSASAGRGFVILSSIAHYASAAAISRTVVAIETDFALPFATAATYRAEPISILPSGKGIVVDSTKTIAFEVSCLHSSRVAPSS